ncbi:MAG: hypothetical protein KF723_14520 [Rhizobiaceae bacterium]|nr:hypothetical protein [Rhizobiaceae bacterium]
MFKKLTTAALTALAIAAGGIGTAQAGYVGAYESETYSQVYFAGNYTEVCIEGDGWSDIDLSVYDENGNLIDASTGSGAFECVSFTPAWTGQFTFVVENYGEGTQFRWVV